MENEQHGKLHILFVCARNRWRSPTAERLYRNDRRMVVRSAGLSEKSPHPLSEADIKWADLILVMEADQKSRIAEKYRHLQLPQIASLDIPDEYEYMEAELIEYIRRGVEYHITGFANHGKSP
jgi:protein-tyrosine phosphatase